MNAGAEQARAIVTSLVFDDTSQAYDIVAALDRDEAEEAIIQLSTDVHALLRRLAFLTESEVETIWRHVVLARIAAEEGT